MLDTGVYIIVCKANGKKYIGSTSKSFKARWKTHINQLKSHTHHSYLLQRCYNKYGIENFDFNVLETCGKEDCFKKEQYYFDTLNPELNICKFAGSIYGRKSTAKTKKKLSRIFKKRNNKGKNSLFYNHEIDANINDIIMLYNFGVSLKDIGKKFNVSKQLIKKRLLSNNIKLRSKDESLFIRKKVEDTSNYTKAAIKRNRFSKKIIDTKTNKIYNNILTASKDLGINYNTLKAKLRGQFKNNTTLKYYENV